MFTKYILGVFGIAFYPAMLFLILFEIGKAFNLKFALTSKNVVYLILDVVFLDLLLHTAFVSRFASGMGLKFGNYLNFLSNVVTFKSGLTVGGLITSILSYPFMCLLSGVGASILFAIGFVIFLGLTVDYYINIKSLDYNNKARNQSARNKVYENEVISGESFASATTIPAQDDIDPVHSTGNRQIDDDDISYVGDSEEGYCSDETYQEEDEQQNKDEEMSQDDEPIDLLTDEKANSHYDPSKFNSVEEYIKYPYAPPIFKGSSQDKVTDSYQEDSYENNSEEEDSSEEFDNNFSEEEEKSGQQSDPFNIGNSSIDDDEDEGLGSRASSRFDNDRAGSRGRSTFDANPFEPFSSGESRRTSNSDRRDDEIFESPAKKFFGASPKVEPEQISIAGVSKPKSYSQEKDREYCPPPTDLLEERSDSVDSYGGDYQKKSSALEQVLSSFNIDAKVTGVVRGPTVTQYELSMPYGTSVRKVLNYDGDIRAALMSKGSVRIEAPIPGKNAVGVEIPNDKRSTVGLKELIESKEFQNSTVNLPIVVGKNISGEVVVKSLPKLVHMLIAGATGSGKSIFLHNIILSLMYKCSPTQLKFIMIDPKRVEFTGYSGMPHMLLPNAVCDCEKAINALDWAVKEMDRRFKKLQKYQVQNIQDFNHCEAVTLLHEEDPMFYLVIVIDELNDLMMAGKKDVEEKITRLAQLGRASGIHMIIATQRPSADVITGTIKNNLPTRVAFSLGSAIDSRVILDEGGAEKLLGAGDMLLSVQESSTSIRLQGGFMSMDEVRKVVNYVKEHNEAYFDEDVEKDILSGSKQEMSSSGGGPDLSAPDDDEFLPAALKLCIESGGASINMVQRRFRVGYARAARIIDQMELKGYVSPGQGAKLRTVYMTMQEYKEKFGED